jgi:hypothetical protein
MKPNTAETLALFKTALGAPNQALTDDVNGPLAKAGITTGTGLVAYDLQPAALSLFPVLTPIRNITPRVAANGGTATNWKAVTGINSLLTDISVSEGNRGAKVTTTTANYVATYKAIGLEDSVSFEADMAAQGFDDVKAKAALNLLRAVMIGEEFLLLNGNASVNLGTTPTPVLVASASGGTMATQGAASVIVVALTPDGYRRALAGPNIVPTAAISKTNVDGSVDTVNPGVAQKSANATVSVTGPTGSIAATVVAVPGAAAYAWYVGTAAGAERLHSITTVNAATLTSYPGASQLASALAGSDLSANGATFDGMLAMTVKSGSGAYVKSLDNAVLTSDGAGNITEIVTAFQYFWDKWRISPTDIWVAGQEIINITKKVIANGGAPLFRLVQDPDVMHAVNGGVRVSALLNPITGTYVSLNVHPNQTAGTIQFYTSEIPYPLSGVGNVSQVKCRRDYYQLTWPLSRRQYEYGVYADEVYQHYATFSLGVLYNIKNG